MSEWISVKERLPEECQLVTGWNGHTMRQMYRGTDGKLRYCITGNEATTVTHWQPLPAPPREEE